MSLRILLTVILLVILNLHFMINKMRVLIHISSGLKTPQESYLDKPILTQSEIKFDLLMNIIKNEIDIKWQEQGCSYMVAKRG